MKMKSLASNKGFWIGAIVVAIIAYVWGKQLIQAASDAGYLTGNTVQSNAEIADGAAAAAGTG